MATLRDIIDGILNRRTPDTAFPASAIGAAGTYNPTFQSGNVQYCGVGNLLAASNNLIFCLSVPTPGGTRAALLLGTGGTDNPNKEMWLITDQAFTNADNGNTLGISAGETQGAGTANGGLLWLIGGGSFGGTGGETRVQGGTSRNGPGGPLNLFGGNSTNGVPGDVFVTAGQNGTAGANVHIIMTKIAGTAGVFRIRVNSTILYEFREHGEIFIGASGAGLAGQPLVSGGVGASPSWQTGFTGTITTAKLTVGGTNGSMTFASGILTAQTAAT